MTTPDEKKKYDGSAEEEILVTDAVPTTPMQAAGPPVPPGHARFYCEKCRTVRPCSFCILHFSCFRFLFSCFLVWVDGFLFGEELWLSHQNQPACCFQFKKMHMAASSLVKCENLVNDASTHNKKRIKKWRKNVHAVKISMIINVFSCGVSIRVRWKRLRRIFSHTIYQKMPRPGGVLVVRHSIPLRLLNAPVVPFFKGDKSEAERKDNYPTEWKWLPIPSSATKKSFLLNRFTIRWRWYYYYLSKPEIIVWSIVHCYPHSYVLYPEIEY